MTNYAAAAAAANDADDVDSDGGSDSSSCDDLSLPVQFLSVKVRFYLSVFIVVFQPATQSVWDTCARTTTVIILKL